MKLQFVKCHGSGNDFLLLDEYTKELPLTDEERSQLTKTLCDRHSGLGADGILFFQKSKIADGRMRVFNSDGSEASMCGNGLRCVARYACELLGKKQLQIETMKAVLAVEETSAIYGAIPTYRVEISPVSFRVEDLPLHIARETCMNEKISDLSEELTFTAVAVPNPHFISIVDREVIQSPIQETISTYLNGENPYFPDGVNVSFVKLLEKGSIYVRTFERGVGFTNACGTAMSASSLVTCLQSENAIEQEITVCNPGGKVKCVVHKQDEEYTIDLIGNATYEYSVTVELSSLSAFQVIQKEDYTQETEEYAKMQADVKQYLQSKM